MSSFSLTLRLKSFVLTFHWCHDMTRNEKGNDEPALVQGNGKAMVKDKSLKLQI